MVGILLLLFCLFSRSAIAQEMSLLDLLITKGVISKAEARKLLSGAKGEEAYNEQALIGLLRAKGILEEEDLAQLQGVPLSSVAPTADVTERLSQLETQQEALTAQAQAQAARQAELKKTSLMSGYDDGFFVRSADGNFSLRVGGWAALHTLYQQEDTKQNSSFNIDRVRLYTEGFLYKYFQYRIQVETASSTILRDAYLNLTYLPQANVQVGQYKVPFSYESLLTKRYLDLVERSAVVLSTVNPARDIGFMLHGKLGGGLLAYQLAVLNGSSQNRADTNSAKDLAARFVLAPFTTYKDSLLTGLNFGGAVTYGHQPKGRSIPGTTPIGFEFFQPVDVRGDRLRVGGHLAWFYGPYSLSGEYIYTSEERQKLGESGENLSDFVTNGGYIGATWLFSGEQKVFGRPNRPRLSFLNPFKDMDGWGSWELAARYEYFTLDNEADGKLGALKRNRYDAARIGVNWYLNPWTRVSVEYVYSLFDDSNRSPRPGHHSVNSVLSRVQIEF